MCRAKMQHFTPLMFKLLFSYLAGACCCLEYLLTIVMGHIWMPIRIDACIVLLERSCWFDYLDSYR